MIAEKFVLGTAQLGMPSYGISRDCSQPTDPFDILYEAESTGISLVDTAASYGDCENIIGAYLKNRPGSQLRIISKLSPNTPLANQNSVRDAVAASAEKVGRKLESFLVHDSTMLYRWDGPLGEGLQRAVQDGLTEKLGVSVYNTREFDTALAIDAMTHIQAPFNVLDRRLLAGERLTVAKRAGRTVQLRSVYLQGLLVMKELSPAMNFARLAWQGFQDVCRKFGVRPHAAAVAWVLDQAAGCSLVMGCDNASQLHENVGLLSAPGVSAECLSALKALPPADEHVINPFLWPS